MTSTEERQNSLLEALDSRILVIDGAMGQMLQLHMTVADYGGAHLENLTDYIVKTRPDVVAGIHKQYLEAGADIIETNTFNGTQMVLSEFQVGDEAYALNKAAAELARKAAEEYSTPEKPRWVAGSMGPTTRAISVTGGVTFDELRQNYYDQARALVDGGVDALLLETCNDTRSV
jgi:5-methyltetrahydrofolate--homocysteine methyltransferase